MEEEKRERRDLGRLELREVLTVTKESSIYLIQYGSGVIEAINEAISAIDAINVEVVKIQYPGRIGKIGD